MKYTMIDNKYYVYLHKLQTTGEVFYVGKGHDRRAWEKTDRNVFWKAKTHNQAYEVVIHKNNLSENEAFELEKQLIAQYGNLNNGGSLVNLTEGGEGRGGFTWGGKRKGNSNPMAGRAHSEEAKQKIALSKVGKPRPYHVVEAARIRNIARPKEEHGMYGKKHTEETRAKMREAAKTRIYKTSDILNLDTGIYYRGWKEVAEVLNLKINQVGLLRKKGKLTNYKTV